MKKNTNTLIISGIICIILGTLLISNNILEEIQALNVSNQVLEVLNKEIGSISQTQEIKHNDYEIYNDLDMPYVKVDGRQYIGIIQLPSIKITLPVQNNWSYELLKNSPCLYYGNVYDDSMIIMAHNYINQFSKIKKLKNNDEVIFIDVRGIAYKYLVSYIEKIDSKNTDKMINNNWDMTLFTCDYSGKSRIAIRCKANNK